MRPISPRPNSRGEKGAFPLFDATRVSRRGPTSLRLPQTCAVGNCEARHPQRTSHLHRADRHDLAVRGQRLERHRAGVRLQLHAQGAAARRHKPRGDRRGLCLSRLPRAFRRRCGAAGLFRQCADARARRSPRGAGGGAAAISTVRSPRPSTCRPGISFEDFKDVYLSAYEQGCKGCTTYRPNEVTGSVLRDDRKRAPRSHRKNRVPPANAAAPRAKRRAATSST